MAEAAFTFLLENVKTAVGKQYRLLSGEKIKEQEEYLRKELQLIKALQKHAERRRSGDERIRLLSRNIIYLLYRLEDAMENITMEVEYPGVKFFRRLVQMASTDAGEFDAEFEEIRNRGDHLSRIVKVIGVNEAVTESSSAGNQRARLSRQTNDHQRKEHFVGRVEEMELLDSYIKDPKCQVIAIWGMGGSGKTALAKKLYQDFQDSNHFYAVAWVHVSQDFEPRRIFEDLYQQFYPYNREDVSEITTEELARQVWEIQRDRKCLVVLDEIWSPDAWETLRIAFPYAETASKILITTRVRHVAEVVAVVAEKSYIHRLRYLTEDESCQLFRERVLQMDLPDNEADKILEMGREVVRFCEGLPLPVINFLLFVATRHILEDLKIEHQNIESYVRKSQEIGGTTSTLHRLSLSYYDLRQDIRQCFLYLGNFREHDLIDAEKLCLLWVADGLISLPHSSGLRLKDVAEEYLDDLAQRSIVEVHEEEVPTVTWFKSCLINQLMRNLSLFKSKEQFFFRVEDFRHGYRPMHDSLSQNQAYRLAINFDMYEDGYDFCLKDNEKKHIRCLLLSVKEDNQSFMWPRKLSSLVAFKYLRILDFDGFDFQVIKRPRDIGKLVHLKYLSFKNCILPKLPSSVGNLTRLLVLDLRVQPLSKIAIPNILWKLKKLMHLYFPESFGTCDAGKLRLESLTQLETLVNFNTGMVNFEDLFQLSNLQYISSKIAGSSKEILCITRRMIGDNSLRTSLDIRNYHCDTEEKHSVLRNVLECESLTVFCMEGRIVRLPFQDRFPQNLAKIVLIGSHLSEDPMETLQHLRALRILILNDDAFVKDRMICSAGGFIELKHLELRNLQKLEKWTVQDQAMPKLSTLTIVNCGKLVMRPDELQIVRRLQQMNAWQIHEELENSLKTVEAQMRADNVQPLPKIMFEHPSDGR